MQSGEIVLCRAYADKDTDMKNKNPPMRKIWTILFALFLVGALPSTAMEGEDTPLEIETDTVHINVKANKVNVLNGEGKDLEIYNLTGVRVSTTPLESNDTNVHLNLPRGCYILKVGKVVRKVTIL